MKDEDYRFSFLYGNYITLTSLGKRGLERIIEQRMSPLYVSVHATDIDVRTRMLGIKRRFDVMAILRQLVAAGIEVHTQVVLCPGWNEGPILEQTFRDLLALAAPRMTTRGLHGGQPARARLRDARASRRAAMTALRTRDGACTMTTTTCALAPAQVADGPRRAPAPAASAPWPSCRSA